MTTQTKEAVSNTQLESAGSSELNGTIESIANIAIIDNYKEMVAKRIMAPFNVPTPKEKVRKRPDGFDYVEGSWMDHVSKDYMPLYKYTLLHVSWELGWISVIVSLEDRITGNIELGGGSARIQVNRGVETPGFRDVIDMGNNLKSALTQAIKNAQSRFGVAADIYGKRESLPTDDERTRFKEMQGILKNISTTKAKLFTDQWDALGTDFSVFLDRWQVFVDRESKEESPKVKKSINY